MAKALRFFSYEIYLFGLVWLIFGLFIRSGDLQAYNLQQMGVDAIVTHGTFTLGHSPLEILKPLGDVFSYREQLHAAKQPGQFAFGALAYMPIKITGLSYESDYIQTAAWVTWFSATSFAALCVTILFSLTYRVWGLSLFSSLFACLTLAFATPLFAYSGVAHHDVIASAFVIVAFYFMERGRKFDQKRDWSLMGVAAGLTLFTSMLPALVILALLITSALSHRHRIVVLTAGFIAGSTPLLIHNWFYFGSPFTQANAAGNYADTFFAPSMALWQQHFNDYFLSGPISIWKYAPALSIGFFALAFLLYQMAMRKGDRPHALKVSTFAICAICFALALHLTYILSIETIGHCQFGPRYLIPVFPLLCLALAPLVEHLLQNQKKWSSIFIALLTAGTVGFSGALAFVGAQIGTMLCNLDIWLAPAFWHSQVKELWLSSYPLRSSLDILLILFVAFIGFIEFLKRSRRPRDT